MPVYTYKAKTEPNVFKTGNIEAESERAAVAKLMHLKYHPVQISLHSEQTARKFKFLERISSKEIYVFLRQLSNLISAGLPLIRALDNISSQTSNRKLHYVVSDLQESIQKGKTFSQAMLEHKNLFSSLEINMVESAEESGTLPKVANKIADLKEKNIEFTNKIRSATAYPVLLLAVGTLTLFMLTSFVLPKFVALFEDLGQQLPLLTQLLINVSLFFEEFWLLIIIFFSIGVLSLLGYIKSSAGKLWFDRLKLKILFLKNITIKVQTATFSRTLASLIENGIPILNALNVVSEIVTNKAFSLQLKNIHSKVAQGESLSEALKECQFFERNTIDLISVGEDSGNLDVMLGRIAKMNETESAQKIESLVLMLEPALILTMGGIIALIVVAILLPIFEMNFLIQ
ncbi:MAG: hypothetical protein DRP78_05835 [Candidatus Omnitrophota bacterium]|nr:MAG: hypothetical protein DRP78_05835 [Candidatus Omnitrophota bacterium]